MLAKEKIEMLEAVYNVCKDTRKHQEEKGQYSACTPFDPNEVAKLLGIPPNDLDDKLRKIDEENNKIFHAGIGVIREVYVPELLDVIHDLKLIDNEIYHKYRDAFQKLSKDRQNALLKLPFLKCRNLYGDIEWDRVPFRERNNIATVELALTANKTAQETISATKYTRHVAIATWILAIATIVMVIINLLVMFYHLTCPIKE